MSARVHKSPHLLEAVQQASIALGALRGQPAFRGGMARSQTGVHKARPSGIVLLRFWHTQVSCFVQTVLVRTNELCLLFIRTRSLLAGVFGPRRSSNPGEADGLQAPEEPPTETHEQARHRARTPSSSSSEEADVCVDATSRYGLRPSKLWRVAVTLEWFWQALHDPVFAGHPE